MQPFLKWAGGKRWLIPRVVKSLPEFKVFYEPFLGSGGMFFALEPRHAVLSDCNTDLINCFRCVRNHCNAVIRILNKLRVDERTYYIVRDKRYTKANKIEKAALFIYLNKTCWNGLYRVNRNGEFNVPKGNLERINKLFDPEQLRAASRLLKRATLKCCDFEEAVRDADRGDLVYFDPPYIRSHMENGFIKYNSKLFSQSDELRLARVAQNLSKTKTSVILSNAAHPTIKQLYDGPFYKTAIQRASCIAGDPDKRSRFAELVITNFSFDLAKR